MKKGKFPGNKKSMEKNKKFRRLFELEFNNQLRINLSCKMTWSLQSKSDKIALKACWMKTTLKQSLTLCTTTLRFRWGILLRISPLINTSVMEEIRITMSTILCSPLRKAAYSTSTTKSCMPSFRIPRSQAS
jgi:hypothetical protein